jgi:hypothetical protein
MAVVVLGRDVEDDEDETGSGALVDGAAEVSAIGSGEGTDTKLLALADCRRS